MKKTLDLRNYFSTAPEPQAKRTLDLRGDLNVVAQTFTKRMEKEPERRIFRVFTDGACRNNGKRGKGKIRKGGIGIHFPDGERPDIGQPYYGHHPLEGSHRALFPAKQPLITNQRSELTAIQVALEQMAAFPEYRRGRDLLRFYSDSMYSINCLTRWVYGWRASGWETASGKPVKNQDILRPLFDAIKGHRFEFIHTPAHTGKQDELSLGNERADQLAQQGVEMWSAAVQ